jgi:hypothetical protein
MVHGSSEVDTFNRRTVWRRFRALDVPPELLPSPVWHHPRPKKTAKSELSFLLFKAPANSRRLTVAPVAFVSRLRETNILFGLMIAIIVLKEANRNKIIGSFAMSTRLALLRLA